MKRETPEQRTERLRKEREESTSLVREAPKAFDFQLVGEEVVKLRGWEIRMEQTRIDVGIWLPERVEVRAAAKIFLLKSLIVERVLNYSDYRLAEAEGSPTSSQRPYR